MSMNNYSNIFDIKDTAINTIAPNFFSMEEINVLNAGLLGYMVELYSNSTIDAYNTIPIMMNEIIPSKARIPDTIYNYASIFQEDGLSASPAKLSTILLLNEQDIQQNAEKSGVYSQFVLDSDMSIFIEDKEFMLDYDININIKPYNGTNVYTASYMTEFNNSMSDITNPYIKVRKMNYNGTKYIALMVTVRRVSKFKQNEIIINNDKINIPSVTFNFNDQIANFEVFYKSPNRPYKIQLKKRLLHTKALHEPFCYFKFKNENTIEISFTRRENFFKPEFNSEITIVYWTTDGSNGNFKEYTGTEVRAVPKSDVYEYNHAVPVLAVPRSGAVDGKDAITFLELKDIVTENFSTVKSYTNENDLNMYFKNYNLRYGHHIEFFKKRNDVFERLFTAFGLFKRKESLYYKTNTVNVDIFPDMFDIEYEQSKKHVLKPGHKFIYKGNSRYDCILTKDEDEIKESEYTYINPFLTSVSKGGVVGYFLNSIKHDIMLEYDYVNRDSLVQFLCSDIHITRNAIKGENAYKIRFYMTPTDEDIDSPLVDENGNDNGRVKSIMVIKDNNKEILYSNCRIVDFDRESKTYTFEANIKTDDYITLSQKIRLTNIKDISDGETVTAMSPMTNVDVTIYSFFRYEEQKQSHKFDYLEDLSRYVLTNSYSTDTQKVHFAKPLPMIKTNMKYKKVKPYEPEWYFNLKSFPVVKADDMVTNDDIFNFMSILEEQYKYMDDILDKKTNNYSVDMKFYNTYGRSRNFKIGESNETLDTVNCRIGFRISLHAGVDDEILNSIKIFIKDYIENINTNGLNGIYISRLIKDVSENFDCIRYIIFTGINTYDASVQNIENMTIDMEAMTKEERINFVPEFLNIELTDIKIQTIK